MKRSSWMMIWLTACLALSACGPGQAFGPTLTPTPTITLTQTATITPIPTITTTPTITLTPTLTPVPYYEGLANLWVMSIDQIPAISRSADIPRLWEQILAKGEAMGGWFAPDAPKVIIRGPYASAGNTTYEIYCPPGACKVVGTVRLAGETTSYEGAQQEIQPVIVIWVLNTEDGPALRFWYAYDPLESKGLTNIDKLLETILPDGSFPGIKNIINAIGLNYDEQMRLSWYQSLLTSPEYADVVALAEEAGSTQSIPEELQELIQFGGAAGVTLASP